MLSLWHASVFAETLACPAGSTLFDWDSPAVAWTTGSTTGSFAQSGIGSVGFTIAIHGGVWLDNPTFGGQTPAEAIYYTAGYIPSGSQNPQSALHMLADFASNAGTADIHITLATAAAGAQFIISDVDDGGAQFRDKITVTGSYRGSSFAPVLNGSAANSVSGNSATGVAAADNSSSAGNVLVTFNRPVDSITIVYGSGAGGPAAPGQQGIGLHDATWCNPNADLLVSKSAVVFDSVAPFHFSLPGNDMKYSIGVANDGAGAVSSGTLFMVDAMPPNIVFYHGDFNGAAPGNDPVAFTDAASGLSWNYATSVGYATGAVRPTSMAQCTYTPISGYDPNVRFICMKPGGSLAGRSGAATPGFTLSFRARIE